MSDENEELALVIFNHNGWGPGVDDKCRGAAEAVLKAGYRKPRTITTVEELNALPIGTVVRSEAKTIAARLDSTAGVLFGMEGSFPWHHLALPATVLWEPQS
jgi:hypothetical protein